MCRPARQETAQTCVSDSVCNCKIHTKTDRYASNIQTLTSMVLSPAYKTLKAT